MLKNNNLNLNILSYLNTKDLCKIESVNTKLKTLASKFSDSWKESCVQNFRGDRSYLSLIEDEQIIEKRCSTQKIDNNSSCNFKDLFKQGAKLKDCWNKCANESSRIYDMQSEELINDILELKNEMFENFKDPNYFPSLRKDKKIFEIPFNSEFQLYQMDYLFDQQHLLSNELIDRKGLFSVLLDKVPEIADSMLSDQSTLQAFYSIYSLQYDDKIEFTNQITSNPFLKLVNLILQTCDFFCRLEAKLISEDQRNFIGSTELTANSYLKSYRSYVNFIMIMNNLLNPLNTLINKIEIYLCKQLKISMSNTPFSFIRAFMKIWLQTVTIPKSNILLDCIYDLNNSRIKNSIKSDYQQLHYGHMTESNTILINLISSFLDSSCSSFNVYYLNSVHFKGSDLYQQLEKGISRQFLQIYKSKSNGNVKEFFEKVIKRDSLLSSDFLIKSSKQRILSYIIELILEDNYMNILIILQLLVESNRTEYEYETTKPKDILSYINFYDNPQSLLYSLVSKLSDEFKMFLSNVMLPRAIMQTSQYCSCTDNVHVAKYLVLYLLNHIMNPSIKDSNHSSLIDIHEYLIEEMKILKIQMQAEDQYLSKELTRKNILQSLFSYKELDFMSDLSSPNTVAWSKINSQAICSFFEFRYHANLYLGRNLVEQLSNNSMDYPILSQKCSIEAKLAESIKLTECHDSDVRVMTYLRFTNI